MLIHTHTHKTKATQRQITQPPGALIDGLLQRTGIAGMKTSEGKKRTGRKEGEHEKG